MVISWRIWNGVHTRAHVPGALWFGENPGPRNLDRDRWWLGFLARSKIIFLPSGENKAGKNGIGSNR